jgi:feruloyl-CoA synthase
MTPSAARELRSDAAKLRPVKLGRKGVVVERKPDGTLYLRSPELLPDYPDTLTERLAHWARAAPERIFLAQRDAQGAWRTLTYAQTYARVRAIAQALLLRDLSPERPIAVLSGNDIEHALLGLAAMHVGIPYAPISPAYSLISSDYGKLRHIIALLTPGLVFASNGEMFSRAIDAVVPAETELVVAANPPAQRPATAFADLLSTQPGAAVDAAHAKTGPDTIAKFLFTSGSTGWPKGVINTQRMLCSNQAMIGWGFAFVRDETPVVVDWLPWSHTFGANHNFGLVLTNGGSLYIDEGKPLPGAIAATVRNLRDIAPTIYFNVPKGFETLLPYLRDDRPLRENFFSRLKVLFYAGAALAPHVRAELERLAIETCGERIVFITSIGSTETAPLALACTWDDPHVGNIGLPAPGVELKLVPRDGKLEARLRGPNITPGYWKSPELTAQAFDEEGFYKIGDTFRFADPADPSEGLLFDGRIAEDFKLASGTWVSVGALRAALIERAAPYVRDVVIAGADRNEVTALIFPDFEACRDLCPDLPAGAAMLADARVRYQFTLLLSALARAATGGSNRVCRAILLDEPASLDAGEMTDKGSINQRAVLARRAALVEELYGRELSPRVIAIEDTR